MAMKRVYDATVGQFAGVAVVTTGNSTPGNAGLDAFAMAVTSVDSSGAQIDLATEATLQQVLSAAQDTATVNVAQDTSIIKNGSTSLTPKFAAIAASSSGNNTIVAAVTSKKIRVLAYSIMATSAVNAKFQSGASGTDLTGLKYLAANGGLVAPFNPVGWFETVAGVLLNLNLSGAVAVGGEIVYIEV